MPRTKVAFQQMRQERTEQILRTAAKVFAQKGFASTKIADLAEAVGISQGLLYRYFLNKEEVLTALIEQASQTALRYAHTALERPGSPWERLRWLTERLLFEIRTQPELCYCFSQAFAIPGSLSGLGSSLETILHQLITGSQEAGQAINRDPEQLVLLYFCCIQGIAAGTMHFGERMLAHFPDTDLVLNILKS